MQKDTKLKTKEEDSCDKHHDESEKSNKDDASDTENRVEIL